MSVGFHLSTKITARFVLVEGMETVLKFNLPTVPSNVTKQDINKAWGNLEGAEKDFEDWLLKEMRR